MKILKQLPPNRRRSVISSQFIEFGVGPLLKTLKDAGITYNIVIGTGARKGDGPQMTKEQRNRSIEGFKRGNADVLVISPAGLEGLDLKGVRNVFLLEPFWTMSKRTQTIGRAERYKSHTHLPTDQRDVTVYDMMLVKKAKPDSPKPAYVAGDEQSVDEHVFENAVEKEETNQAFLKKLQSVGIKA